MDVQQRHDQIRQLVDTATPDMLRTALLEVLDSTLSAQRRRDYCDYGIDGGRSTEVVDAEHDARSSVGYNIDSDLLHTLQS
jgi:hypothetical protein